MPRVFVDPKNLSRTERIIRLCSSGQKDQAIHLLYEWVKTNKMIKYEFGSVLEKITESHPNE